ncbi:hypothetical protein [Caulobacter segnis]|uniref:hypothetical protein n=1 Tax=Caulobacter segnis TaxID=88688 RepID=UPI00285E11AE|nr:hypothetical protein [Caulobacter segnis]MDR6625014.1 hypothetical protein [Caulobacter segnis]
MIVEFLKFCSVATAGLFALSAVTNGIFFWAAWRVNYFMVANPADVVMGGFTILRHVAWIFIPAYLVMWLCRWAVEHFADRLNLRDSRIRTLEEIRAEAAEERLIMLYSALLMTLFISFSYSLYGLSDWNKSGWRLLSHRVHQPKVYLSGLRVAQESKLDNQCLGSDILWLGSSSAIIDCSHGVRVIHKLDDLVTELATEVPIDER